ncbi:unnamed protein product [Closterium sp. NIES-53]
MHARCDSSAQGFRLGCQCTALSLPCFALPYFLLLPFLPPRLPLHITPPPSPPPLPSSLHVSCSKGGQGACWGCCQHCCLRGQQQRSLASSTPRCSAHCPSSPGPTGTPSPLPSPFPLLPLLRSSTPRLAIPPMPSLVSLPSKNPFTASSTPTRIHFHHHPSLPLPPPPMLVFPERLCRWAGREVVPEVVGEVGPGEVAAVAARLLGDAAALEAMGRALRQVAREYGGAKGSASGEGEGEGGGSDGGESGEGAADAIADEVLKLLLISSAARTPTSPRPSRLPLVLIVLVALPALPILPLVPRRHLSLAPPSTESPLGARNKHAHFPPPLVLPSPASPLCARSLCAGGQAAVDWAAVRTTDHLTVGDCMSAGKLVCAQPSTTVDQGPCSTVDQGPCSTVDQVGPASRHCSPPPSAPPPFPAISPFSLFHPLSPPPPFFPPPPPTPPPLVRAALELLVEHRITGMPVVDAEGRLVGVVSDYDLLALDSISGVGSSGPSSSLFPEAGSTWKAFKEIQKLLIKTRGRVVADVMTPHPHTVHPSTNLDQAARMLLENQHRRLPVVDGNGKLVGLITRGNVVKAALALKRAAERDQAKSAAQ